MNLWASMVRAWVLSGAAFLAALACAFSLGLRADPGVQGDEALLPALNPAFSPLATENRPLLADRLVAAFEWNYAIHFTHTEDRALSDGMTVYHLQRELQACVDMWRATGRITYLDQATNLTLLAIEEARINPRPLIWHSESRGEWPCFYLDTVAADTGGHSQLCDFQGGVGFLTVARALDELDLPAARQIADFVERQIVQKWLYYKPSITQQNLTGTDSDKYLLAVLNTGRVVREHFACICLDLHALGYDSHPYRDWASLLVELYLTPRYDPDQPAPCEDRAPGRIPEDWGLPVVTMDDGATCLYILDADPDNPTGVLDTSHANRTAWLAAKSYAEGLVDKSILDGLANTFRHQIWAPQKGPFYFNNYTDGSDGQLGGLGPGRGGNIWFGWHRLAAYNPDLEELFLSIAYDLTNGGLNLPDGAQNKTMTEAPLCLEAWAARLLAARQTRTFP
jgi:hypothetical protein